MTLDEALVAYAPPLVMPLFVALLALALAVALARRFPALTRAATALALLTLTVFSLPLTANALLGALERRYPPTPLESLPTADAVVFLAGATDPPVPPRREAELGARGDRLLLAARLIKAGKAPRLFLSGAGREETAHGRDYDVEILGEWGIGRERIVTERDSRDTKGSAGAMGPLLAGEGVESILLVTSAYHMPRAMRLYAGLVPSITPVAANHFVRPGAGRGLADWIPTALALSGSTLALHEHLGMLELGLRGGGGRAAPRGPGATP